MREAQHSGGSVSAAATDQARAGTQNTPDKLACSVDVLASMLADLREQVARLEADVRRLQSRTVNRA